MSSVEVLLAQQSFIFTFLSPATRDKWLEEVSSIRSKWTETVLTTSMHPGAEDRIELSPSPSKKKDKKKDKDKLKEVKAKDSGFKSKIKKGTKEVLDVAKEGFNDVKKA